MPREKADFRGTMEMLNRRFPEHDMLELHQCMEVYGWKSETTARKHLRPIIDPVSKKINKAALARLMCP